ncbi:MAG: cytochrome c biogenesis protein CcdA [Kiritimatiellia bacterium]
MRVLALAFAVACTFLSALARPVCVGEMCYPSEEAARAAGVSPEAIQKALLDEHADGPQAASPVATTPAESPRADSVRVAMGYMKPPEFLAFLRNQASATTDLERHSLPIIVLLVLLGGLLANLTPCVLPLVPVNLMLVGRGWRRGAAYGLGIALAYGALGIAAALGGMAFGTIQASPWFSAFVAVVFTVLGLAMSEVFFIDFTKYRARVAGGRDQLRGLGGVFLLGVGAAVLAGACVEPILLATLLLTAKWFAAGKAWAVALPFVLGLGMGLPWPFAAAGLAVLPKPGPWMRWVNRVFAGVFFCMAAWYGWLAWTGFAARAATPETRAAALDARMEATPATWEQTFAAARAKGRPVFVDVWATWCKNCLAMEKTTFRDDEVVRELARFTVVRLQAEDPAAFAQLKDFADLGIKGIPAFVIFGEH